ncbi:MAG: hypothetical protein HY303_09380 [Candidatus Wallbacteria bacterium]|nr:hypothetical protein [Candidatus Wallbacteria bacterium]
MLRRKELGRLISDFYTMEETPAITFACAIIEKPGDNFRGVVGAELNLDFIQNILVSVRVGRTGEILLANQAGSVIFSSPGFKGLDDFKEFNIQKAFQQTRGNVEYGVKTPRLAAYQRIQALAINTILDVGSQPAPFWESLAPSMIPDWLVVVQQHAEEAYMVAERMKYNLIILVIVGVIGLVVIARLWLESL